MKRLRSEDIGDYEYSDNNQEDLEDVQTSIFLLVFLRTMQSLIRRRAGCGRALQKPGKWNGESPGVIQDDKPKDQSGCKEVAEK
jgi:hypothetical protein